LLAVLCAALALVIVTSTSALPSQSLNGEYVDIPDFMPQVIQTSTCVDHPDGSQSFEYTIVPQAMANPGVFYAKGPYPGPYTFTFTGTLGPAGPISGGPGGNFWRRIIELTGTFIIQSGATTVTGTLFLDPSSPSAVDPSGHWATAVCNNATAWSGHLQTSYLRWDATIDDGAGTLDDHGVAAGGFDGSGPVTISNSFGKPLSVYFTSVPLSLDADGDGVPDAFDADGGDGSSTDGLLATDGTGTSGTLTAGSLTSVTDVDSPKGYRLTAGPEGATLTMCAEALEVELDPNTSATITCGSVSVENVTDGSVTVTFGDTDVVFAPNSSGTVDTTPGGGLTVSGVSGDATLSVGDVTVPVPEGDFNVIPGGMGNSTITGTAGNDMIVDQGGYNTIDGKGGDDSITVSGSGNNTIKGGAGNDTITTGSGNDTIDGGDGDDVIDAGDGSNTVKGGKGNDDITTGSGKDTIDGGQGTDTCDPGGPPGKNSVKGCELP
jgi:Ca2+-binding RTX toxin-like protein